ncbi:MAG: signal peptidase I [Lentimonas sp.]|jgi:signal peptidase I
MNQKIINLLKFQSQKKEKKPESWNSFFGTLAIAILLATLVRSLFFEPFHIPSSSMKSNLLIGDYIFVSKYSYGYSRYSFPLGLDLFSGRIFRSKPQRGDVIVFRLPSDPKINYIKRLIGLPKDKIQIKDGQVFINDEAVKKEFVDDFIDDDGTALKRFKETLPEGREILVLDQSSDAVQDNTGIYYIPEGHYFMMGDNRDNSQDSRFLNAVGYIPEENLVGKARIVFFSSSDSFWKLWTWPTNIRWKRLIHKIS